ncbi:MAG: FkbM family methyltransferase [Hyphomonadaceae bacterium]
MSILSSLRYHLGLARAFGMPAAVSLGIRRKFGLRKPVTARWQGQRVVVRPRESDPVVASSVLGWQEYALGERAETALSRLAQKWHARGRTPVIIDGGANVGYAALHFAKLYPEAVIIAVEPNPETFDVLRQNCAGYPQIRPVLGALWSHDQGVSLQSDPESSWSDRVHDGGLTPSFRLQDLLASVPNSRSLIIKLDIEGAEGEVCRAAPEVLRTTACLLIEPHDYLRPGASVLSPVYDALNGLQVDTLLVGEYIAVIASSLMREPVTEMVTVAAPAPSAMIAEAKLATAQ